eukprot:9299669-Ditylum_brightwellii.AAC.1
MIIVGAAAMQEQLEDDDEIDQYEKLQPAKPDVDIHLKDTHIEQYWEFTDNETGDMVPMQCKGVVVTVKNNTRVHVEWEYLYLREGDPKVTEEKFLKTKWNKHVDEGWRMNPDYL